MHTILLPQSRIRRAIESFRHPDQAAIAARLPIAGSRVPIRWYWRRQSLQPERALRHLGSDLDGLKTPAVRPAVTKATRASARLAREARHAGAGARVRARSAARLAAPVADRARERSRAVIRDTRERTAPKIARAGAAVTEAGAHVRPPRLRGVARVVTIAAIFAAGAAAMYFSDEHSGRRRRALVRDRLAHWRNVVRRELPRRVNKRRRFVEGVARGVQHNMGEIVQPHHVVPDDDTLVARVRSEALRDGLAGRVNVDAYEGCVTLRGELQSHAVIQRLIDRAGNVDGVREVRSYLHLPGTLPPNKAEVYEKERLPAHLAAGGDQGIGLIN